MNQISKIILILIILVVLTYFFNLKYHSKENFKVNSQNFVVNNAFENAELLDYGNDDKMNGMYKTKNNSVMGPSSVIGVDQNSGQDVYDNRGYKWASNSVDPQVDTFTQSVDDAQLRNKFERTYMLDPDGSVAQYDIAYNKVSPNCCPAQYAPPFKLTDKDSSNCDFAQKYVANQYSGMNFNDGYGCVCITPKQADFYGSRGGNTD